MAATPSLTIIKLFQYRGADEEWGNTYHFSGGTPADDTHWKALADAVIADEKTCYKSTSAVVRGYGHVPGTNHAIWTYDYLHGSGHVPGTLGLTGGYDSMAGDQAGVLEWPTAAFTTRGKRIYLRKFFHDGGQGTSSHVDEIDPACITAYDAFGAAWVSGYISATYKIAGPQGAAGGTPRTLPYVTTRTLKRRGKRP